MARATLTRIYISVELIDGTVLEDLRVTIADQARYQRTARVNKWKDDPVRQNTFLAWASAERQKLTTMTWEAWAEAVEDLDAANVSAAEDRAYDAGGDDEADPTRQQD